MSYRWSTILMKNGKLEATTAVYAMPSSAILMKNVIMTSTCSGARGYRVRRSEFTPKHCLFPFIREAKRQRRLMGDELVGEKHLLLAYHRDLRFGNQLFTRLRVSETSLKKAIQIVQAYSPR
ncbi:hypothetical protein L1887_29520 [Cichorium endivia]|nr:hypothetical protein L1887_29520 [Cichorium endivia]